MSHKITEAKDMLLQEGKRLLIEEGYRNFSIRNVVNGCGLSTGTFYNNFKTKEELATKILYMDWEAMLNSMDSIKAEDESFKNKLNDVYLLLRDFFSNYKDIFFEMLIERVPERSSNIEIKEAFCERLVPIINSERESGGITCDIDDRKLSYLILQNFIYMSKEDYITFEDFFRCLKLK